MNSKIICFVRICHIREVFLDCIGILVHYFTHNHIKEKQILMHISVKLALFILLLLCCGQTVQRTAHRL